MMSHAIGRCHGQAAHELFHKPCDGLRQRITAAPPRHLCGFLLNDCGTMASALTTFSKVDEKSDAAQRLLSIALEAESASGWHQTLQREKELHRSSFQASFYASCGRPSRIMICASA